MYIIRAAKRISGPKGKRRLSPPPPILQLMILKLSPPRTQYNKNKLMNCDLENSFPLVYLSGSLIITHGPRGAARMTPLSMGLYIIIRFIVFFVGSLFATLSSTELLFTAFSQLIYGGIYKWSVSFFPGLVFVIMACVLVLVLILSM